jgi:hypothetical protein
MSLRVAFDMGLDPANHRLHIAAAKFGPAPASARGRPQVLPGSFSLLVEEFAYVLERALL